MPIIKLVVSTDIIHINADFIGMYFLGTQSQVIIFPRHQLKLNRIIQRVVPLFLIGESGAVEQSAFQFQRQTLL